MRAFSWLGVFFIILALFVLSMGFIMDMFTRMRQNQEEILYYLKKAQYSSKKDEA